MSSSAYNYLLLIEILIFVLIFIPTIIAFLSGAPWVPTPMPCVKRMLELANIKRGDKVYDLGCGDGRMVQSAAKIYGADAVGVELSPLVYLMARTRNLFVRSKAKFLLRDFRSLDYSNAKAIVFYLLPGVLKVMKPKFEKELKPGTRLISYAFEIEGWTPIHIEPKNKERNHCRILVYEVPKSINPKGSDAKK